MNWQPPILMALQTTEEIKKRVSDSTAQGITIPESAIERSVETSNPFTTAYWFPEQASIFAGDVDDLFMEIFWISLVFFVIIIGCMVYFCIKYRRKDGKIDPQPSSSHNTTIEILWSVLPSILLVYMFVDGASTYMRMETPKPEAEEIKVVAFQFGWKFIYPNGDMTNELHLVLDKPVMLKMQSNDVLHSFFVPAFRQKQDIVPGRYTYAYIEPTKTGQFRLSCNEYCGDGHSKMRTMCEVHIDEQHRLENTEWKTPDYSAWENGKHLYTIHCAGCHNIDGKDATGPALNLTWNRKVELADGTVVTADDNYVKESILNPSEKIVKDFGSAGKVSKMNSFKGVLSEEPMGDIDHIIEYLNYLQDPSSVDDTKLKDLKKEE